MDSEINIQSEVSQIKTNIIWYHIYVDNVNKLAGIDNKLMVTKEEKGVH